MNGDSPANVNITLFPSSFDTYSSSLKYVPLGKYIGYTDSSSIDVVEFLLELFAEFLLET